MNVENLSCTGSSILASSSGGGSSDSDINNKNKESNQNRSSILIQSSTCVDRNLITKENHVQLNGNAHASSENDLNEHSNASGIKTKLNDTPTYIGKKIESSYIYYEFAVISGLF